MSDDLADRLAEGFDLVGPLCRHGQRRVGWDAPIEGLSVGVRAVLNLLREYGPMTVPDLGRAQGLSRQFTQRMVNDAAARELVAIVPNPAHKRSSLIEVTEIGAVVINAVITRERSVLRRIAGQVTEAEVEACIRVLNTTLQVVADVEAD